MAQQQAGCLAQAEALLQRLLSLDPKHVLGLHQLGSIARQTGRLDVAVAMYTRASTLARDVAAIHLNLATALNEQGRPDQAIALYQQALALQPDFPEAYFNLGNILRDRGAATAAISCFERALVCRADYANALFNLGNALKDQGELDQAIARYRQLLTIQPTSIDALANLGNALEDQGRLDDALHCYERALLLQPDFCAARYNSGNVLAAQGQLDRARRRYEEALMLKPAFGDALYNLGNVLRDQGLAMQAIAHYEQALSLAPHDAKIHSNLLTSLHYAAAYAPADILARARRFAALCAAPAPVGGHAQRTEEKQRLRIGYVSGDFGKHPVGYFLSAVLEAHERSAVEVFCYSNRAKEDALTARLRGSADHWRSLVGLPDEAAARLIEQDAIDILVDLSGHTAKNRLPLFARRLAPVQASWLGYFGTTGLASVDYLIADRFVAPPASDSYFTEAIWRLPDSYLCFTPPHETIALQTPPATRGHALTFGSFNNQAKTSPQTIALWARVLQRVPGSRLLLKTKSLGDPCVRKLLAEQFSAQGIDADRLMLEGASPRLELLSAYNRVDIGLDPTPYGGGTTTAEALWMGVPVVTLRGTTWVGRVSESIVSAVGYPGLTAATADAYVDLAARLATDLPQLATLRAGLRAQLVVSPLCAGRAFTRNLEQAYRGMWQRCCAVAAGENATAHSSLY